MGGDARAKLSDAEEYAAAKMRLLRGFDEVDDMLNHGRELQVDAGNIEELLEPLKWIEGHGWEAKSPGPPTEGGTGAPDSVLIESRNGLNVTNITPFGDVHTRSEQQQSLYNQGVHTG